jgi:hypothetical protein
MMHAPKAYSLTKATFFYHPIVRGGMRFALWIGCFSIIPMLWMMIHIPRKILWVPTKNVLEEPHYYALDAKYQAYSLHAKKAFLLQNQRVLFEKPWARFQEKKGRNAHLKGDRGVYDKKVRNLSLTGRVTFTTSDDYCFSMPRAFADLRKKEIHGFDGVQGYGPLGTLKGKSVWLQSQRIFLLGPAKIVFKALDPKKGLGL